MRKLLLEAQQQAAVARRHPPHPIQKDHDGLDARTAAPHEHREHGCRPCLRQWQRRDLAPGDQQAEDQERERERTAQADPRPHQHVVAEQGQQPPGSRPAVAVQPGEPWR